jgi:23S rRNA (guanosine2251-2'-O)-methyltransferase
MEALRGGRRVLRLHVSARRVKSLAGIVERARETGVEIAVIHDMRFFESRWPKGHQGVAAEVEGGGSTDLDSLLAIPGSSGEPALFVVLDEIEDPRNAGAIIRTAEAAGAHGLVVQERRSANLAGPIVAKASAGAIEHIAITVVPNVKNALDAMAEAGVLIVGAEAGGEDAPWDIDMRGPIALVVGSEGRGLRRVVRERCAKVASIPMRGMVNSLNASVAVGALLYEVIRQRAGGTEKG